ncbi:MAG: adenine deaminase [Lachnospiraceae bacterium]|nr:adenine deaminase [Lachnospiraceae bacterium]
MYHVDHRTQRIAVALGEKKATLVLKNAHILNVFTNQFEDGDIAIENGFVVGIGQYEGETEVDLKHKTVVPGFMDAHMHLESAAVTPNEYYKAVVGHGTTTVVADPHEIANVCGREGIDFILDTTQDIPLEVFLMIPSCVPATVFDETGCKIGQKDVEFYLENVRCLGLAEMMNYHGVITKEKEVISKIRATMKAGKIVDGHAPGLHGKELDAYITSGVYSDHECTNYEEGFEKLSHGQWIMIREGTACKNLESLRGLLAYPFSERCLFATDDKHLGDLLCEGHIDYMIRKAILLGVDPVIAYKVASYNAARYFRLQTHGAISPGYVADIVVLDDFETVKIHSVYKAGKLVADLQENWILNEEKQLDKSAIRSTILNSVNVAKVTPDDFSIKRAKEKTIGLIPGEIITTDEGETDHIDVSKDILKLAVVERHHHTGHIGVAFAKGYGLKSGAVATSVAHDSHNIIVIGATEEDMAMAVNEIKNMQGGMVVVQDGKILEELALPIAGLMCTLPVKEAKEQMERVKNAAYQLGVNRDIDPFMTLSFCSLPVIPALKLTPCGVVDVEKFELV